MKRTRRKALRRRPKSPSLPPKSSQGAETVSIVRELTTSLLDPNSTMTPENRRAFERALHDQIGKTMLHLSAVALHKQRRHAKLLGMADFVLNFASDPEYMKIMCSQPDTMVKFLSLIHKMEGDDTKFLHDLAVGAKKKEDMGFDAEKALNLVIGLVGAAGNNLPPELQEPGKLKNFRLIAQDLIDVLEGDPLPEKPEKSMRVISTKKPEEDVDGD